MTHLYLLLVSSLLQVSCATSGIHKSEKVSAQNDVMHTSEQEQIMTATQHQNSNELLAQSIELDKLEAQINEQNIELNKRPRRAFAGARPREYRFAQYVELWRQKVERVGNVNYPKEAKEQKLYGQVQLTVCIFRDGTVEKIELNKSSGYRVLDEAAERIVRLAAPFALFPADIYKDTDILCITRTWTFTKEDSLGPSETGDSQAIEK